MLLIFLYFKIYSMTQFDLIYSKFTAGMMGVVDDDGQRPPFFEL